MKKEFYSSAWLYFFVLLSIPLLLPSQNTSDYCAAKGNKNSVWINNLNFGDWKHSSGNNNGYLQVTNLDWPLLSGLKYVIHLDMGGVVRIQDTLYWQIWADFNGDKDFQDANEQLFKAKTLQRLPAKGALNLPEGLLSGTYHFRIILSKKAFASSCGEGAEVQEVEDYQFNIQGLESCLPIDTGNVQIHLLGDSTALVTLHNPDSSLYTLELYDQGQTLLETYKFLPTDSMLLPKLNPGSTYGVRVQRYCPPVSISKWSPQILFNTRTATCEAIEIQHFNVRSLDGNQFQFIANIPAQSYHWRYRIQGQSVWADSLSSYTDSLNWRCPYDDLTLIELQLSITCGNRAISAWSPSRIFQSTERSCTLPPNDLISARVEPETGHLVLQVGTSAQLFYWRLRAVGAASWKIITTTQSGLRIDSVFTEDQEVQLQMWCINGKLSEWSTSKIIKFSKPDCPQVRANATKHFYYFYGYYTSVHVTWESKASGPSTMATYRWSFREEHADEWSSPVRTPGPSASLTGMSPGKTYEIKMEIICDQDSLNPLSVIEVKKLPLSCVEIDESLINLYISPTTVNIEVASEGDVPLQLRFGRKGSTQLDTLIGLGGWLRYIDTLRVDHEYEVSVRGYCLDGTEMPWSDPLYFKTLSCDLPGYGEIDIEEFAPLDSIVFAANFSYYKPLDTSSWQYQWRYRTRDSSDWNITALNKSNFPTFVARNLAANTNYEVQLITHCVQNPLDSFVLSTFFSTDSAQCGTKPDTSLLDFTKEQWSSIRFTCNLPDAYLWEARVLKRENNKWVVSPAEVYLRLPADYNVPVEDEKALQFRLICPNKTVSPWSEIIFPGDFIQFGEPVLLSQGFVEKTKLSVAPNPSKGQFNIALPKPMLTEPQEIWLEVYNLAGQSILNRKIHLAAGDVLPLDLSEQHSGIYFLRIKVGQELFTHKLLLNTDR